jgi:hypothetical protein
VEPVIALAVLMVFVIRVLIIVAKLQETVLAVGHLFAEFGSL